jgi:hypothetical protein
VKWEHCTRFSGAEIIRSVEVHDPIATGFVESTVNQVVSKRCCKKQQMQWSKPGAPLLLQTRVKTLDGELGALFKRWYPDMDIEAEEIPAAA